MVDSGPTVHAELRGVAEPVDATQETALSCLQRRPGGRTYRVWPARLALHAPAGYEIAPKRSAKVERELDEGRVTSLWRTSTVP